MNAKTINERDGTDKGNATDTSSLTGSSSQTVLETSNDFNVLEDALKRGGKNDSEVDSVVTVDRAQTEASHVQDKDGPLHKAFMEGHVSIELFSCLGDQSEWTDSPARVVLEDSINEVLHHEKAGTLYGADEKLTDAVHDALGVTHFWGLPIPPQYGGSGASMFFCMRAITRMAAVASEIVGGLLSIEELIGAAGPLIWKGTAEQNAELLPLLASGQLRSGFAGTERYVGCWITNVHTYGVEDGDDIVVTGDKLFISNAWYGHMVALFLKIEGEPKVLLVKLPDKDTETFRIVNYPIRALRRIHNKGLWFKNFRVPKKYLLPGNGLSAIFHDLDRGRPAVAAGASARMHRLLKSEMPWVDTRITFGEKLKTRQFIKHNMAVQAAYIAGADALVDWSTSLMDAGFQGDVSAMIAKTWATDRLREVVTNQAMFTHGGRFVLGGHPIGDNLVDDLVSSVYEGPNPMLGKATIKSLAKPLTEEYIRPLILHMKRIGLDPSRLRFGNFKESILSLRYLFKQRSRILTDGGFNGQAGEAGLVQTAGYMWKNRKQLHGRRIWTTAIPLVKWMIKAELTFTDNEDVSGLEPGLQNLLDYTREAFLRWRKKFYRAVVVYQEKLADEDLLMLEELYKPLEAITTIFVSIAAAQKARDAGDQATYDALLLLCLILKRGLTRESSYSGSYKKLVNSVFEHLEKGNFKQIEDVPAAPVLMPYTEDDFETWGLK
jgi:alkylation response protein AidB-like acyl-CoA dehydrogenase